MGRLIVSMNTSLDGFIEAAGDDDGSWLRIDEEVHLAFNDLVHARHDGSVSLPGRRQTRRIEAHRCGTLRMDATTEGGRAVAFGNGMHVIALDAPGGFEAIVARVASLVEPSSRPRIVALDGRSGAGKSTLAARIAAATGATVIDGDGFFAGGVELRRDMPAQRAAACIDWRRQREVLAALREGCGASYRAFDWEAFDGSLELAPTVIEPAPRFILEGVYAARPELADLVDLRILLCVTDEVRLRRLEGREGGIGEWERAWHEAEAWYFANEAPDTWFDVVVHGGATDAR